MSEHSTVATFEDGAHWENPDAGEMAVTREARERLEIAYSGTEDERALYTSDVKFLDGEAQWSQTAKDQRGSDRPMLTMNKLPAFVDQATGENRQNKVAIRVTATDAAGDEKMTTRAGKQMSRAEAYMGIIRDIEQQEGGQEAYDTAFETVVAGGIGYWRLLTEYVDDDVFEQKITYERILDPLTVYFDPSAKKADFSDIRYCFVIDWMKADEFKRRYPKQAPPGDLDATIWQHWDRWKKLKQDEIMLADYYRRVAVKRTILLLSDGRVIDKAEHEKILDELADAGVTVVDERETRSHKVEWFKIGGTRIVEGPVEVPCRWIPVFKASGKELVVDGTVKRRGIVRNAKDPQRAYNYWRSATTETVALQPKMPYIAAFEQIEDRLDEWNSANSENRMVLLYNHVTGLDAPKRQAPPQISPGMVQETIVADQDLRATVGQFNASIGDSDTSKQSGTAIALLQQKTSINVFPFTDNLARAIRHCGRCLVSMIPRIYDTQRIVRLLHEDQSEDFLQLFEEVTDEETGKKQLVNDLRAGKYGTTVQVGPSFATQRIAATNQMLAYMERDPDAAPLLRDLVVGNMDHPAARVASDRLRKTVPENLLEGERGDEGEQRTTSMADKVAAVKAEAELATANAKVATAEANEAKARVELFVAMTEAGMNPEALQVLIEQQVTDMTRELEGAPGQTTPPDEIPPGATGLQ